MAEVVGEVDASLSLEHSLGLSDWRSLTLFSGLEECLSLVQLGLLGMSDSQEQFGEQGASYLLIKNILARISSNPFHHRS